jgi:5-methylcytosine-specific restriction endonuclease McrA
MPNPNGSHWIRTRKRLRIYARDSHRCVWCGTSVTPKLTATLDHFLPRNCAGGNEATNLLTACRHCNNIRYGYSALAFACKLARWDFARVAEILDRCFAAMDRPLPPLPP